MNMEISEAFKGAFERMVIHFFGDRLPLNEQIDNSQQLRCVQSLLLNSFSIPSELCRCDESSLHICSLKPKV